MSDALDNAKSKLLHYVVTLARMATSPPRHEVRIENDEVEAIVDDIVAAAVEAAGASTGVELHKLREHLTKIFGKSDLHRHGLEQRLGALEQRQPGNDRQLLALMAATLAATDNERPIERAREILTGVERQLGIVSLTEEVPAAATMYVRHAGGDAWHISADLVGGFTDPGATVEVLCGGRIVPTLQRRCSQTEEPDDLCPDCHKAS